MALLDHTQKRVPGKAVSPKAGVAGASRGTEQIHSLTLSLALDQVAKPTVTPRNTFPLHAETLINLRFDAYRVMSDQLHLAV